MSLFQRIKTPFDDGADGLPAEPAGRSRTVGALLRDRREELDLGLDAIGEALRIKPIYLAALEQERAQDLPGATYAIGFIRAYAQYLGLDTERILARYKAECADVHARPDLSLPVPLGARSVPGGPILLVGVILAVCGYGTWYYLSTGERSRPERVAAVPADLQRAAQGAAAPLSPAAPRGTSRPATAPVSGPGTAPGTAPGSGSAGASPAPRLSSGLLAPPDASRAPAIPVPASSSQNSPAQGSPVQGSPGPGVVAGPAATASSAPAAPVPPASSDPAREALSARPDPRPEATGAPSGDTGVKLGGQIDIRALTDCWIQVRAADQSIVFSRVLKAGETYHVPRAGLFLRTGNAGALAIAVEGKPAPTIGGVGMLRRNVALDPEALLAGTAVRG